MALHRLRRARRTVVAFIALAGVLVAGVAWAAIVPGSPPDPPVVSNFGRLIAPKGQLTRLSVFPTGAAMTPDGQYLWTVSAGRYANIVEITRIADGGLVDKLVGPGGRAYEGGIAIAADGRHAYVAETHDKVVSFDVDPDTGHATEAKTIDIPVDSNAQPPDDFPPRTSGPVGYPSGLALTPDGKTLVVALNLDDRVAVVDTASGASTQVQVRPDSRPGDRAYPREVAIVGSTALVTDEGDGTIASFPLSDPSSIKRSVPVLPGGDEVDAAKRHPDEILAAPDGRSAYVSLTNDDRVIQIDAADPSHVLASYAVRRAEGLGTEPTGLALGPHGDTLFVADAGEDVVRALALTRRHGLRPGDEIARIPSGIYPDAVAYSAAAHTLAIVSAKGTGPGPVVPVDEAADNDSVSHRIIGLLQTLPFDGGPAHRDALLRAYGHAGGRVPVPVDRAVAAPPGSPVVGPDGGASDKIKYVFYVVAENKTYDTLFGDLPQGDGDPCLVVYGARRSLPMQRDGSPCPQDGHHSKYPAVRSPGRLNDGTPVTPNQHALANTFVTLDRTFSDAETSDDGHNWASGGYTSDFEMRQSLAENSPAPRPALALLYPAAQPPRGYLFDAAARQGVSFHNYGEAVSGTVIPDSTLSPAEQAVRETVLARSSLSEDYPSDGAIDVDIFPPNRLVDDSIPPHQVDPTKEVSRMAFVESVLDKQLAACPDPSVAAACAVPQFNELTFPNNHTAGTGDPTRRSPDALVRDNDLAIGQLVDFVSHSKIWPYSAIFVVQDDAQDGADHVEGHRIAALVASPYAKRHEVVSTHYDTMSVLATIERILGMRPSYMFDGLGAPMWDVFNSTPDDTPFDATPIDDSLLTEHNSPNDPSAALSRRYVWRTDAVPEAVVNRMQWMYRYGTARSCPRNGRRGVSGNPCGLGHRLPKGDVNDG